MLGQDWAINLARWTHREGRV